MSSLDGPLSVSMWDELTFNFEKELLKPCLQPQNTFSCWLVSIQALSATESQLQLFHKFTFTFTLPCFVSGAGTQPQQSIQPPPRTTSFPLVKMQLCMACISKKSSIQPLPLKPWEGTRYSRSLKSQGAHHIHQHSTLTV